MNKPLLKAELTVYPFDDWHQLLRGKSRIAAAGGGPESASEGILHGSVQTFHGRNTIQNSRMGPAAPGPPD